MILGFGSTETEQQDKIRRLLLAAAIRGKNLHDVSERWNAERSKYDKLPRATAPERYTQFYVYDDKIVYHHIHRNHPFSADGWAMMKVEEPLEPAATGAKP